MPIKKKLYALVLVFCFFELSFDRLEHCLEVHGNFVIGNWSEPGSVPRTVEIEACENYLKQLNNALYLKKHDSTLVKQILLWGAGESSEIYGTKLTLLMGRLASVVPDTVDTNVMQLLNYYRLALCDVFFVRNYFYYCFRSLSIKSEEQFKQTLIGMVGLYKIKYPCDAADEKRFQELINYVWTDQDVEDTDFSKIK